MASFFTMNFLTELLLSTVRMATPILLVALAETYSERAGMVNIGLDGIMAIGALVGFLVGYETGSPWAGVLAGALSGIATNMIYAFCTITLCAEQTVYGMAINIFAPALASFIYRLSFSDPGRVYGDHAHPGTQQDPDDRKYLLPAESSCVWGISSGCRDSGIFKPYKGGTEFQGCR